MKEAWKDIPNYEGLYQISNLGRVRSLEKTIFSGGVARRRKERILKSTNRRGYRQLTLSKGGDKEQKSVHRLVAESFIPNPDCKPEVNHIDGDKANNKMNNLEWCTRRENAVHSIRVLGHKPKTEQIEPFQIKGAYSGWNNKKVKCVETGEVFDSIAKAGRAKGIARGSLGRITYCCTGKKYGNKKVKSVGGYRWEFV